MKIKKIMLAACLLAVLAVSWLFVLKKAAGTEEREKQEELVQKADSYLEQELYIRAIPLYQESLLYDAGNNAQIEQKLLKAYQKYEDISSYIDLVQSRIKRGCAEQGECLKAAGYYLESRSVKNAMELLKSAMEQLDSKELERFYEENRYEYRLLATPWTDITPTASNTLMPAFDGRNWYYVDEAGRIQLDGGYEQALPFDSNGYAAVRINGGYVTILENGDWYGRDQTGVSDVYAVSNGHILAQADGTYGYYDYDYTNIAPKHQYEEITGNSCNAAAVKKDGRWGIISDEGDVITDFLLEDVAVNSLGCVFANDTAMVKKDGSWILINAQGDQISEAEFADAKAPESGGYIAVADVSGKWGFIDQKGNLVIDYQYKDASSFSNQLAAVRQTDTWGYISRKGELVIDEAFQDAEPFHNGRAQASLAGYETIVELSYFEE